MEVEYLTKTEWTETINELFSALEGLNNSLMTIASYFHLFIVVGGAILVLILMYKTLLKFL